MEVPEQQMAAKGGIPAPGTQTQLGAVMVLLTSLFFDQMGWAARSTALVAFLAAKLGVDHFYHGYFGLGLGIAIIAMLAAGIFADHLGDKRQILVMGLFLNGTGGILLILPGEFTTFLGEAMLLVGFAMSRQGQMSYYGYLWQSGRPVSEPGYYLFYGVTLLGALVGGLLGIVATEVVGNPISLLFIGVLGILHAVGLIVLSKNEVLPQERANESSGLRLKGRTLFCWVSILAIVLVSTALIASVGTNTTNFLGPELGINFVGIVLLLVCFLLIAIEPRANALRRNGLIALVCLLQITFWASYGAIFAGLSPSSSGESFSDYSRLQSVVGVVVAFGLIALISFLSGGQNRVSYRWQGLRILIGIAMLLPFTLLVPNLLFNLPTLAIPVIGTMGGLEILVAATCMGAMWRLAPPGGKGKAMAVYLASGYYGTSLGGFVSRFNYDFLGMPIGATGYLSTGLVLLSLGIALAAYMMLKNLTDEDGLALTNNPFGF